MKSTHSSEPCSQTGTMTPMLARLRYPDRKKNAEEPVFIQAMVSLRKSPRSGELARRDARPTVPAFGHAGYFVIDSLYHL